MGKTQVQSHSIRQTLKGAGECSITAMNHFPLQNYTFGQNDWTLAALKWPDPEIMGSPQLPARTIISH